jgi:hypothetical protein
MDVLGDRNGRSGLGKANLAASGSVGRVCEMKITRSNPERRTCDNIVFDSIAEMEHWQGLKLLQQAGRIRELKYGTKFHFIIDGVSIGSYKADFTYQDEFNKTHVVDVKGWRTSKTGRRLPRVDKGFRLRANLLKALFGLEVEIA